MTPFANSIVQAMRRALTTLYPAGVNTWNGQPTKVTPVATLLTPGEHPAAEEINYLDNDRGERLTEARNDMLQVQQRGEIATLRATSNVTEDLRGATMTPQGKYYRAVCSAVPTADDFTRVVKGFSSPKMLGFPVQPAIGGNRTATFVQAAGELVLMGDSPSSYIYNASAGTFSAAITVGGASVILDAIQSATPGAGWIALCAQHLAYGAFNLNLSAPRTYKAKGVNFEIRTIGIAGAIGADTASGALAAAEANGGFGVGDTIRPHLIRGKNSDIMILFSGRVLSKKYAAFSGDDGATWTTVTLPDPFAAAPTPSTFTVEWCSITERFVLAVDDFTNTKVYWSQDGGVTWTQTGPNYARAPAAAWGDITFGPYDIRRMASGVLVALSHGCADILGGIYTPIHVSQDGGDTWNLAELVPLLGAGFHTLGLHSAPTMCLGGGSNDSRYGAHLLGAQGI